MTVLYNHQFSTARNLYYIHGAFSVGASGAPTLITTNGRSAGIKAVSRSSTAIYAIQVGSPTGAEFFVREYFVSALATLNGTPKYYVTGMYSSATLSTSTRSIRFLTPHMFAGPNVDSLLTDLTSGTIVYFLIRMVGM